MIKLRIPVIVEGKYDKAKLSSIVDANIITTNGFSVFNNEEKKIMIRRLCKDGVILLCDSDGGGRVIRSYLKGIVEGEVYDLYTPEIKGKEKRKSSPSKAGILGVEGVDSHLLCEIFERFVNNHPEAAVEPDETIVRECVTKNNLYELGLNGREGAAEKRREISRILGFPSEMTVNAFLEAVNMLYDRETFIKIVNNR